MSFESCRICFKTGGDALLPSPCQCRGKVHLVCLQTNFEDRRCWDDLKCPRCRYLYELRVAIHLGKIALRELLNEYGSGDLHVATALANIGNAYGKLGDIERQKEYLEKALKIDGSRHDLIVDVGKAYGQLGQLAKKRELLEEAVDMLERKHHEEAVSIDKLEKEYGSTHPDLAPILILLGDMHGELKFEIPWSDRWEEQLQDQFVKHAPARKLSVDELWSLMKVSDKQGESIDLDDVRGQSNASTVEPPVLLEIGSNESTGVGVSALAGCDTPEEIEWSTRFPITIEIDADSVRQRPLFEKALHIQELVYGSDHCELAVPLTKLGNVWGRLGLIERKHELLERALNIQLRELGPKHREVAVIRFNLAHATYGLDNIDEAIHLMKLAKSSFHSNFGRKHRHTRAAERALTYWRQFQDRSSVQESELISPSALSPDSAVSNPLHDGRLGAPDDEPLYSSQTSVKFAEASPHYSSQASVKSSVRFADDTKFSEDVDTMSLDGTETTERLADE